MKWRLIAQAGHGADTVWEALSDAKSSDLDRLDVAVAYATLQGVRCLELALNDVNLVSRWVVGVDDAITQPQALEYLVGLRCSKVRLASMLPKKRFHPKLYCLWSSNDKHKGVTVVGSGNMTLNGMLHNGETAVLLESESPEETKALRRQWKAMWRLGKPATQQRIDAYRLGYIEGRKRRVELVDLDLSPPEPEPDAAVEIGAAVVSDFGDAKLVWLDAGTASAGGRDLEFPRRMVPFFGLTKSPTLRTFEMRDGQRFTLRLTERKDNGMWRLMFNRDSVQSSIGRESLRPKSGGNRSDLAVVIREVDGPADYELSMVLVGSREYERLVSRSRALAGLDRTMQGPGGRNYGFG